MTTEIRPTTAADREQVLAVVRAAFATRGRDGETEVKVVRATWEREAAPPGLDLVAVEGEEVVGHVLGGVGTMAGEPALGLAPLAVAPAWQRRGVGSALVEHFLGAAEAGGWPFVTLLGDPMYYSRFGFEPAAGLGLHYAPVGVGDPAFQVRRLAGFDARQPRGEFVYCWEL